MVGSDVGALPARGRKGVDPVSSNEADNKARFRRTYEEMLNRGDLSVVDEVIAPDFLNHEAPPGMDRGPESMRGVVAMLRTAYPDLQFTIEELIAEGDIVAGRVTMRGTHRGPLMGMPPTGRSVRQAQMHFVRFRDGKAVEHWGVRDELGLMQQLGVMPGRAEGEPREC
jgi:steroid delta-isomerase-like uncharacterized protein